MKQTEKELVIESLNQDGYGTAIYENKWGRKKNVEALFSLPGEKVNAFIFTSKKKAIAKPVEILEKSSERIEARCAHFGSCGGCMLQHMRYDSQKSFKQKGIEVLFSNWQEKIASLIAPDTPWSYRNKMEWTFSEDANENKFLGLLIKHSRGKVCHIHECHLVNSWMNDARLDIFAWWKQTDLGSYHHIHNRGSLETVTFREGVNSGDKLIMLTVSSNPDYALNKAHLTSFVEAVKKYATAIILRIHQRLKGSPTQWYEMKLYGKDSFCESYTIDFAGVKRSVEFQVSPSSFLQPNTKMAEVIYSKALTMAKLTKDDILYDLYAGIGVFGMLAAPFVKQVISIESNADSVFDAKTNKELLELENVVIYKGDVAHILEDEEIEPPTVVIVDPPRSGLMQKAIEQIAKLSPERIVYVSCNPKTQKEDILALEERGFLVSSIQPIDQFPHTAHVENIITLTKGSHT